MKTMARFLMLLTIVLFTSCTEEGDVYNTILGTVFETSGSFTEANKYSLYYEFPSNFVIYDTDVVMVYILWDQIDKVDI